MTRVLIVDDHPFFRNCLVDLVSGSGDLTVVGECADGAAVAAAVAELEPRVVVMDIRMRTMSGLEAAAILQRQAPTARVLMLTSDASATSRCAARSCGAAGYLHKGGDGGELLDAIRLLAVGGTVWPDDDQATSQRGGYSDVASRHLGTPPGTTAT